MNTKTQDLAQRAQRSPRHRKSFSSLCEHCGLGAIFLLAVVFAFFTASTRGADVAKKSPDLPEDIRRGLVLYYDFESKPVGDKITDLSGSKNDGKAIADDGKAVAVEWVKDPQRGGVIKFGRKNSYITVPNNDSLNPPHLTLAVWIKASICKGVRNIFRKSENDEGGDWWGLLLAGKYNHANPNEGKVSFYPFKGYSSAISGPDGRVTDNQWHHVVATYDGSEAKVYVDGKQPAGPRKPYSGEVKSTLSDLAIGKSNWDPIQEPTLMDDVMMFNRALSAEEVQVLFKLQDGKSESTPAARPQSTPSPAPEDTLTPADRIKQIKRLLERGEIKQEEHDRRIKEILDAI